MSRFVVEVEADAYSADFLLGYLRTGLPPLGRNLIVLKVEAGSIQDVCDEVHALRDRLEAPPGGGAA